MLQNLKSGLVSLGRHNLCCPHTACRFRNRQTAGEGFKFGRREPLHRPQIGELVGEVARRVLKPVPVQIGAMNAERAANGVPIFRRANLVLARKDLDAVDLLEGPLDRDVEAKGKTIYI
jgi:hypothetical protein